MNATYYSPASISFWKAYVIHMRPYLWFISGFAGLSGAFVTLEILDFRFYLSLIPFFLSYGFGQALTDCFQIDTDKISSPYRPLSRGIIRKKDVFRVSLIGLIICGSILFYLNLYNAIFATLSIIGLAAYSYVKKNFWIFGPPLNSFVVSLLPLMGYLCFLQDEEEINISEILPISIVMFLAYNIFVLMGYLKDISADRTAGYKTFTVVWGWDKTVLISDVLYLASFYLVYANQWLDGLNWIFYLMAMAGALAGQVKAHVQKVKTEEYAFFPIIQSVRSFLFICYTIVSHFSSQMFLPIIMAHLLFEVIIYYRPERSQI